MNLLKSMLPTKVKAILRGLRKWVRYTYRYWRIRLAGRFVSSMNVILGAAETRQKGWYATNEQWLDISSAHNWEQIFEGRVLLHRALAEHVLEHLTSEETQRALQLVYKHMLPGGRIRIAVPDGYNPNPEYLRHVCINGDGADAADHKQLLNVDVLFQFLKDAGFVPSHLEGYTKDGRLVQNQYSPEDGYVLRSRASNFAGAETAGWEFPDSRTSLIVDGVKP